MQPTPREHHGFNSNVTGAESLILIIPPLKRAMFIKARTIVILGVVIVLAMIAEWKFVSFMTEDRTIHNYHGICNDGVGQPYADFVHELRTLSESGNTNALARVLRGADEHSRDIFEVWLANRRDAYRESIHEILK